MAANNPHEFDIDVDLGAVLDDTEAAPLINSRWYELNHRRRLRTPQVLRALDEGFRNVMLQAQWRARAQRSLDRRRALRVPIIARVHPEDGRYLTACDISLSGLRCSGQPTAPVMDVEFKLPGQVIPIDAKVEVMTYKESNVIPLVGLRFASIDRPYVDMIAEYVAHRRERLAA